MRLRAVLVGLGVAVVGLGALLAVRPGLAAGVRLPRLAVVLVGAIALVEGLRAIEDRREGTIEGARPPGVEAGVSTPAPGDDVDELLGAAARAPVPEEEERLRRRLRAAAVAVVAARDGISRSAAADRVDSGTWTDDPVAAAFLGGPAAPEPPLEGRLRTLVDAPTPTRAYAERTIDAIHAAWEAA